MYNKLKTITKYYLSILLISICILLPNIGHASNSFVNFLPMEDAMSSSRNVVALDKTDIKPFREKVNFKKQDTKKAGIADIDLFAFILLVIVFFVISKRNSRSRKINL